MIHFITHFDETYRAQGMAMLQTLFLNAPVKDTRIHVFWMGSGKLSTFSWCTIIDIEEVMGADRRLYTARTNRPYREFCWTLEPAIVDFTLHKLSLARTIDDTVIYVDADSFFFSDPLPGIRASMRDTSIALTQHHFPPDKMNKARTVGKFNFGFGAFRVNTVSRSIVKSWLDKTLANCTGLENDQTYLDEWPAQLGNQFVEMPRGFNVGPWQQIQVNHPFVSPELFGKSVDGEIFPLITYHFHEMRRGPGRNSISLGNPKAVTKDVWNRSNYDLHPSVIEHIYKPYEQALQEWL